MATLTQLQLLGESWIDFHGPGEPQKLFQEKRQLEMLDGYAGNAKARLKYHYLYDEWRATLREIDVLTLCLPDCMILHFSHNRVVVHLCMVRE